MTAGIDPAFAALPLAAIADAGLAAAARLGARFASVHVITTRTCRHRLRDGLPAGGGDATDTAVGVRVVAGGAWGFAGTDDLTPAAAAAAAAEAVAVAGACAPLARRPVELVDEPVHGDVTWVGPVDVDPCDVPRAERTALLAAWSRQALAAPEVAHVLALLTAVRESRFYADAAGTTATQQRVRVHPMLIASTPGRNGAPVSLRTLAPPVGRGWEYLTGTGWDWDAELAALPGLLAEKERATPVRPGRYDLVIDGSQLWHTIHETVGHATELDRALGWEASYAGTTFVPPDGVGELRLGSPLMNVVADRTTNHGLATVGIDDEGVAAGSWDLVSSGVLAGWQTDRASAAQAGIASSTGCSFAESGLDAPLARMANVSLQPDPGGPGLTQLIGGVEDGIYLAGSDSWSIDTRREDFQFTAQRAHRIRGGRLAGQLSGVAYRGRTADFWGRLAAVGGERTYALFGADLCGKGQPMQSAAASHGSPAAVFTGVEVVDPGTGS